MPIGGHHQCERCGAQLSRYNHDTVCAPCQTACRSLQVADGAVLLAGGELDGAVDTLRAAVTDAVTYRLPHQLQRVIRALDPAPTDAAAALRDNATTMLDQLRRRLTVPALA
jgi:hypothetical protein